MSSRKQVTSEVEPIIETVERITLSSRMMLTPSRSLRPGMGMIEAAAEGNEDACAIRDAWRFKSPVTVLSQEQFDAMVARNQVVFIG